MKKYFQTNLYIHVYLKQEMKETLTKELDFENEAENSKRCFNELKHLKFVYVPKVYDEKTTKVKNKI